MYLPLYLAIASRVYDSTIYWWRHMQKIYITVYIVYLWYIIHFKTPNFPNKLLPISQNTK